MRLRIFVFPIAFVYYSCANGAKHHPQAIASPEELGIEDPDPNDTENQINFCNPTGKTGEELKKCFEFNQTFYQSFDDEAKKREPWFHFPVDSWAQSIEIDHKKVFPVVHEEEAIKRLETQAILPLTNEEAKHFTGQPQTSTTEKPYLVRALYYFRETGSFSVFRKQQSILVQHESTGQSNSAEKRTALVVYLEFTPKDVYIDCGVSE